MDKIFRMAPSVLCSKKYVSIVYALWIAANYFYLQVDLTAYHYEDLMTSSAFLSYIVPSYSLVTIAYFLWLIWYNREKRLSDKMIKTMLSVAMLIVVIGATYWLKYAYEGLPYLKYYGPGWTGSGTEYSVNPGLTHFRWAQLCSFIPCIGLSVWIYWIESNRETSSHPVIRDISQVVVLYIPYFLTCSLLSFFGLPFLCLLVLLKNKTIPVGKGISCVITVVIITVLLIEAILTGPLDETMSLTGAGPVSGYYAIALFLLLPFNLCFYVAVFTGLIFVGIKKVFKLKMEKPFFKGFIITVGLGASQLLTYIWIKISEILW